MKKGVFYIFFIISSISSHSQNELGSLTGNVESIFQYLNQDSLIEANQPDSKSLINTYMKQASYALLYFKLKLPLCYWKYYNNNIFLYEL